MDRQQVIDYMQLDAYRPMTVQELVEEFGLESGEDFRAFVKLLNELEEAGEVVRTRTNRYGVPERMNLVVGHLQMKARGYAFLISEIPGEPDLYIAASDLNGALSGDKVMARVERVSTGPRREGKVIRVLERATNRVVGRFTKHRDHAFVTPLDKRFPQDLFIATEDMMDAHDGYVVLVEITTYPTATRGPEGKVVEVLGHPDAPGVDILAVIKKYGLPEEFSEQVLTAAEAIPLELSEQDFAHRRDLRDETIVTIDGEDAKDLDDAVHVKRLENGNYLLGVHIADVGYYVKEGSPLDKEAYKRGTSVYLVDRVIPMLPQRLSNNICSLNPQVDRLTMSCEMEISPNGETVRHDIFPSVIRTAERMTYNHVRRILVDRDEKVMERYEPLVPMFELMEELALILRRHRMSRGAIDFDFEEVKVIVDDLGHPTDIVPRVRSIAERIIEEFMLAANETIAEHFFWLGTPFLYRIHEEPELDRMIEFNEFIHNFGYHVKGLGNRIHPRSLQDVLKKIEGAREQRVISTLMLRSMKQARYAPDSTGHFGLAAEYYTHFTSPIRRYPDLMIHRIIREALTSKMPPEREMQLKEKVAEAAIQSSERERTAQDAERETDQLKMVEYMLDHIDEAFDGLISGVTQFGLFIQLENGVEGLIHISYLTDDYYVLNEKQMALVGERTRRVFRLGDPVRVKVISASKENLTIDFELVSHHREGTLVYDEGVATVIYDEDLSPKERKRQMAEREHRGRRREPGFKYVSHKSGNGGANTERPGHPKGERGRDRDQRDNEQEVSAGRVEKGRRLIDASGEGATFEFTEHRKNKSGKGNGKNGGKSSAKGKHGSSGTGKPGKGNKSGKGGRPSEFIAGGLKAAKKSKMRGGKG